MRFQQDQHWHAIPADAVLRDFGSGACGLDREEATRRLAEFGPNRMPPPKRRGPLMRLLLQFHNLLVYVLLAAAIVTALLGHWLDTAVILSVLVINALIGFVQEGRAEQALAAIRKMLSLQAVVMRDGRKVAVAAEELVPGDLVFIQSGDKVPADLRLSHAKNLKLQEAILTGESLPVDKQVAAVPEGAELGDRFSMAYSGTLVASGQGTGVVVATGAATQIGRISALLAEVQYLTTPLLAQLSVFGRWLTLGIALLAGATFVFGAFVQAYPLSEMFLATVGLAVAAIPEGLPAIMTITLAVGVRRMAAQNAIIRRLPAVETLGSLSVICSDKTGTLTRNEMTVQAVVTARHRFEVTGVGYAPVGSFLLDGRDILPDHRPLLTEMMRGAMLCSDAQLREVDGQWSVAGDPTEGALVVVARKAGLDPAFEEKSCPRKDVIPFESEHRFMATLHHDHTGAAQIYVKGAPERIVEMCQLQRGQGGDEPLDTDYWHEAMQQLAGRGQRVLALASRDAAAGKGDLCFADVEWGLVLIGLFGLADPPREEAVAAIAQCRKAGISVKMITGDHAATASAIAGQLGLENSGKVLTGRELDELSPDSLAAQAAAVNVFARTSPEHKLRLVEALQRAGNVVAMTGDGVNDAPALKRADVGVAMGIKGTEAAKEAAEMVLADDNFASISHAVEEGRTVYDNLRKSIMFILPTNGGEALTIVLAIALGRLMPITPVQILWVNMITAVTLALALAFEPAEDDVMDRPPRARAVPILSRFLIWRICFVSLILVSGTFGVFVWLRDQGAGIELARTAAVNTLVMFELFYLFCTRFRLASVFRPAALSGSPAVLIAVAIVLIFQMIFTYTPAMQLLFATQPLDLASWAVIVPVAASVLVLVELEKFFFRQSDRLRRLISD